MSSTPSLSSKDGHDLENELPNQMYNSENLEKGARIPDLPVDSTDWNGADDPLNPLNWPAWKRYFHIVPPALISFSAYVSFDCRVFFDHSHVGLSSCSSHLTSEFLGANVV